jgi:hypothetical protein
MFEKTNIEALFGELEQWRGKPEFEQLSRDTHLGIALYDTGQTLQGRVDPRVVALIEKHKPKE